MKLNDSGIVFNSADHTYFLGNKQLNGITEFIGNYLFKDKYSNVPKFILNKAAEKGTSIHEACMAYDIFGICDRKEVEWYRNLKEREKFNVIENEYLVTDYDFFASGIDKVLEIDNKIYLADVKTTYKLDKNYLRWQLSIYRYLFNIVNPDIEVAGLKYIWIRDGIEMGDIDEIPQEIIIDFLVAAKNGYPFDNPFKSSITVSNDESDLVLTLINNLTDVITQIKQLEDLKKKYNEKIEELFNEVGADVWETDYFKITRTKDYERVVFDTNRFKKDYPDLFDKYKKINQVKGSIKTTLK